LRLREERPVREAPVDSGELAESVVTVGMVPFAVEAGLPAYQLTA
jgi:hypothetical protein